ncbi:MAG TPA: DUF192 domain-containing protein [Acidimicrobiia bacterium]|nr:DUF192 domain-containing protein [Acidimicrobiia bacterium]
MTLAAGVAVAAGCGTSAPGGVASTSESTAVSTTAVVSTREVEVDTGDLVDPAIRTITVDGTDYLVAFADQPEARARGLMGVEDLGDLDGMLFDLEVERDANFVMRDTLIPLDIVFFAADGTGRTMLTMEPCRAEPCPTYPSGAPVRFALEVPAGTTELSADSVLVVP